MGYWTKFLDISSIKHNFRFTSEFCQSFDLTYLLWTCARDSINCARAINEAHIHMLASDHHRPCKTAMRCLELGATHQVNDDIFAPLRPPLGRDLAHVHHRLRVVCINVEDGSVDDARHVRAVGRRTGGARVCRETNLQHKIVMYKLKVKFQSWFAFVSVLLTSSCQLLIRRGTKRSFILRHDKVQ